MKEIMTPWQRLVNMLKLDRRDMIQVFYYAIFAGLVNLSLPLGIQAIINLIQGAQMSTSWIILVILVTMGVAFAGTLQIMQLRIIEDIQQKIFVRASFEFTYRFPKIKMSALRNFYPPELANRFFDTITVQKGLAKLLVDVPTSLLQILFGLLLLSFYHPFFILYGVLLVLIGYLVFKFTAKRGLITSLLESKNKYRVAHWIQEVARTIFTFKLSGKTTHALDKNDILVAEYLESREKHFKILISQFIQLIGFKVLVTLGLLLIGGFLVLNQQMNIGQFVAAEIIILLVISSVEKLVGSIETIYDTLTSLEKIGQVVDKELEDQEAASTIDPVKRFHLELSKVTYTIVPEDRLLLDAIDLMIPPGARILLRGPNGSGKATLLKLLGGVLEPSKGTIFVNDVSLKAIRINDYRAFVGQSLPEETPFEGTILDNITLGNRELTEADVYWAIEKMGLTDFVKAQPKGLRTIIFPEGKQLSNTLSRKIVLARSIVTKPKLILLKDPLEHFTQEEAKKIAAFFVDPSHHWSLVVASQNELWTSLCDTTYLLTEGKLTSINR